ncbi:CLMN protein, partial [Rhinopomastus cyanomelas]|nr:CLMN protein [Rhinopomastus cyanomelas]
LSTQHEISDDSLSDVSKNPEDLDSCDEADSSSEVLPSSSKVSVIPHDLFYYPHYNVPISAVLNAYLEPRIEGYDTGNDKPSSETVTDVLHEDLAEQNYKEDTPEPDLGNKLGAPPSEMDTETGEEENKDINSNENSSDEKEVLLLVEEELEIEKHDKMATDSQDYTVSRDPEV